MNRTTICVFGIVVYLGAVQCVLGDGVVRDGLGACSIGRGGTNIAFADNGEVLYDNPAGMVNVEGRGLVDLGVNVLITDLQYGDPQNPGTGAWHNPFPIPEASVIKKSDDGQWAFGLGVFTPAGFATDWDLQEGGTMPGQLPLGTYHYRSLGAMAKFLPGVAYQVNDRLSVGATLGLGLGHTELEGPYFLQTGLPPLIPPGTPTIMRLYTTGVAPTWSFGLQYQLSDATTIGATYQSASYYSQTGSANVDLPGLGSSEFKSEFDITWPASVGIGIKYDLCPHRIFSADVIWFGWSTAFDHAGVRLTNPSNPVFAALAPGGLSDQMPLDWRDSVSVRLGYEQHLLHGHIIRAGYAYHANQIPSQILTPYIPATLEHAFSLGYGWQHEAWEINLAYQYSFGPEVDVAQSGLAGGNFNNSWDRDQAHWMSASLIRRF